MVELGARGGWVGGGRVFFFLKLMFLLIWVEENLIVLEVCSFDEKEEVEKRLEFKKV